MLLKLADYGRKGIHAYLCPITLQAGKVQRGKFINGIPAPEHRRRASEGKSVIVVIDLADKPDGLYELKEASGHKSAVSYVWIEGGQTVEEWDTLEELLDDKLPLPELPELSGSTAQVKWANAIRANAVRAGYPAEKARQLVEAKSWIDLRSSMPGQSQGVE